MKIYVMIFHACFLLPPLSLPPLPLLVLLSVWCVRACVCVCVCIYQPFYVTYCLSFPPSTESSMFLPSTCVSTYEPPLCLLVA